LDRIERLLDAGIEHRRHGAATICFMGVLAGWFDAFYEPALNIWDAAAGVLLVDEGVERCRMIHWQAFFWHPLTSWRATASLQNWLRFLPVEPEFP